MQSSTISLRYEWVRVFYYCSLQTMPSIMLGTRKSLVSPCSFHMPFNPNFLSFSRSRSPLFLFKYKLNFTNRTHHHPAKRCILCSNGHNFILNQLGLSPDQINYKKINAYHFISSKLQAHNTPKTLKDMGKHAFSIASLFLFAFLLQQLELPICSAITQIRNSDFQSNREKNLNSNDLQTIPIVRNSSNYVIDIAKVLSPEKAMEVGSDLEALQDISDWKIRVLTRTGPSPSPSENPLRDLWQPDDRTVIIVEDISSPNILNFGTGSIVASRLPRQFFIELQSRYGNQFFVSDEGYQTALLNTIDAIKQCLVKEDGCNTVPGLTDDLYFLTLATSMAGGAVFGFAARLTPQGRVDESWQWVVLLSPLWVLLFVLLGILPIVGRTSDLEPVLKNGFGFLGAAAAFYLTPLFGKSPIGKNQ
ncbi:hypothetical protein SUGI_0914860 [Cryptomeria japonica]|nr:hypothetical protein SUGI_0914860 [Cryptomeria japonica]